MREGTRLKYAGGQVSARKYLERHDRDAIAKLDAAATGGYSDEERVLKSNGH